MCRHFEQDFGLVAGYHNLYGPLRPTAGAIENASFGRTYDPAIDNLHIKRAMALDAYCQSPLYFREIEEMLHWELEFTTTPSGLSERTVQQIGQSDEKL
jgi:hypothetical protein